MTFGEYFYSGEQTWIRPDGHSDPSNLWTDEADAYDGDTSTCAVTSLDIDKWGSFIGLTFSKAIISNKLRIHVLCHSLDLIDIIAKINGSLVHVYQGTIQNRTWVEKTFSKGLVSEIQVRFYRPSSSAMSLKEIFEVDLWQVTEPEPEPEPQLSKNCLMMALFGTTLLARCFPYLRLFRDRVLPQIITDSYYTFSTWILAVVG